MTQNNTPCRVQHDQGNSAPFLDTGSLFRSMHPMAPVTPWVPTTASGINLPYLHALIFAHDSSQLQVTLDLLPDLLEAVHDGHGGDGVDAAQDVQGHVDQPLLPRDLPVLDDGRGRGVDAQHGVVGAGIVLGAVLICSNNGWKCEMFVMGNGVIQRAAT